VTGRSATASILTVEDDAIVRADLRLVLEEAGFEVCADARDGEEAVELERRHRPDLVLMDIGLPRADGVEAIRRIRRTRDVPVVALTGHRSGDVVERALEAGASAHVLKPFQSAGLVGTVTRALADHRARRADAERERRHHLAMIEAMLRDGLSEQEIEQGLRRANGWDDEALREGPIRRLRRIVGRRRSTGERGA
jgi:CheY-like chemotaxis protein